MSILLAGDPYPLGATWDGEGVNFALSSGHAERAELCFFGSPEDSREAERISLPEKTNVIWHADLPGVEPGQLYGYRTHGPYDPRAGHRFNAQKVLLDPYAKAIGRALAWGDEVLGYTIGDANEDLSFDACDDAARAPLGVVVDPGFDWGVGDRPPGKRWREPVIYETHVKGFAQQHPQVAGKLRGTYGRLASEASLAHLKRLGVTVVELMRTHLAARNPVKKLARVASLTWDYFWHHLYVFRNF